MPPVTAPTLAAINPALFAQPGESFAQYEARVAGGNGGATSVPVAPVAPVATSTTPATTPSTDTQTGITADQYQLQPGETTDQYNTRISGLRSSSGMPDTSGAVTGVQTAEDKVAQSLGYKSYQDAVTALTATPSKSETDLYNSAYSAAGLDGLQNTITGRQNDLATAQNKINDNPWLDEASRTGRNNTVTTLANADIKNYQTEYTNKLKEVQDLVTREVADGTANTAANKAKLAALESQAKQLATEAAATTKADNAAPKTVKGATGATYSWNPTTQTFDQILPGKAAGSTTPKPSTGDAISGMDSELKSVTGKDGYIDPNNWATALSAWQAKGLSASSFVSNFKKYANTADPKNNYTGLTKPK